MKKLLSVILSVVMIVSMVACLSFATNAEATEELKVSVVEDDGKKFIEVSYTDNDPFMVTYIEFAVTGVTIEDNLEAGVPTTWVIDGDITATDKNKPAIDARLDNGTLKVLVSPAGDLVQYTSVVFDIPATIAEKHSIIPTLMQAAADGNDIETAEHFVELPFTGDGDVIKAGDPAVVVDESANPSEGPVEDTNLVVSGASTGFGTSSLQVTFRVKKTVFELYDSVKLVITADKYDVTTYNLATPVEYVITSDKMNSAGTFYTYIYNDIQLYELGLNFTYQLKAYDADGNYVAYSAPVTSSVAQNLKALYALENDAELHTAIADILVAGDIATKYFAPAGTDAANATSIIEGFDTSAASASVGTLNTVDSFQSVIASFDNVSTAVNYTTKSVAIGKAPYVNIRIKDAVKAIDLDKLSINFAYTAEDSYGSHPQNITATGADFKRAGNYITYAFDQVGLMDGDKDISITISYDGATACTLTYSIETYLNANISSTEPGEFATLGQITTALAKMGASARVYLLA